MHKPVSCCAYATSYWDTYWWKCKADQTSFYGFLWGKKRRVVVKQDSRKIDLQSHDHMLQETFISKSDERLLSQDSYPIKEGTLFNRESVMGT